MIQSVDRAIDIVSYIAGQANPPSLADISQDLHLNKSTAHRFLACLLAKGVVERDFTNRYRVGARVFQWSGSLLQRGALSALVLPFLESLREETGETASFHILAGRNYVCVEQVESRHEIRRKIEVGKAYPLGPGATAKAILANLPPGERCAIVQELAKNGFPELDRSAFEEELAQVRESCTAMSQGERIPGAASASAPLFNSSGKVVGAISLSGPAYRLTMEVLEGYTPRLKEIAVKISRELGYCPSQELVLA